MIEILDFEVTVDTRTLFHASGLKLDAGTVGALYGPNGSGKSTFLRALALGGAPTGSVTIGGHDAGTPAAQRILGYVPADPPLHDRLTAAEHVALVRQLWRLPPSTDDLQRWGLTGSADVLAAGLSTGQRRRLALALSLVHQPKVWLLDEPWNGLDDEGRRVLGEHLDDLRAGGGTALVAVHEWPMEVPDAERWVIDEGVLRAIPRLPIGPAGRMS